MAQAPMMPLWTDALIGDTTHLSTEQFGAYVLILIATWRNNGEALENDDKQLANVSRLSVRRWREKVRPILQRFFEISDDGWHQKRLEAEWDHVSGILTKRRAAASAGGQASAANRRTSKGQPTYNHNQESTPQTPRQRGARLKMNGKEKEPRYGPLRDPVEIAKELGIRK